MYKNSENYFVNRFLSDLVALKGSETFQIRLPI